jgi:exo-beta-1,3-glucanase (GH17 family)
VLPSASAALVAGRLPTSSVSGHDGTAATPDSQAAGATSSISAMQTAVAAIGGEAFTHGAWNTPGGHKHTALLMGSLREG